MSKFRKTPGIRCAQSKKGTVQDHDANLGIGLVFKGCQEPLDMQDNSAIILDGKETSARAWGIIVTVQARDRW